MNQYDISKANELYEKGLVSELNEFLKPFLDNDDPYALYFCSRFSLVEWDETDEEFDQRSLVFLTKAAKADVVEAMYQLSSLYFTGDTVVKDVAKGKRYLDRALELNFGPAKMSVGLNLYYGSNSYPKDIEKAISLISDAKNDNVEGAESVLNRIKEDTR
jgi:TPR repeat protein